jgi:hypothetical protein
VDTHLVSGTAEFEDFTHWLEIAVSSSAWQDTVPGRLDLPGPDRLPEMIEAVRDALLACLAGLEDCNSRKRRHWRRTHMNRQNGYPSELDLEEVALRRETALWDEKIRWSQELYACLKRALERCEAPLASESGRVCA